MLGSFSSFGAKRFQSSVLAKQSTPPVACDLDSYINCHAPSHTAFLLRYRILPDIHLLYDAYIPKSSMASND